LADLSSCFVSGICPEPSGRYFSKENDCSRQKAYFCTEYEQYNKGNNMAKINVKNKEVSVIQINNEDYISLTDIAKFKTADPNAVIGSWMRNRNTIEYGGIWECLYNPNFKPLEFEGFKKEAGLNAFTLSPQKWIETTAAIGIASKSGRYGGPFAHKDIAFKFASWISIEFELYIGKEFQRLKEEEQKALGWSAKREPAKINYHIHTDAIKQHLIPPELTSQQVSITYATEADVLNVALFGKTAAQWWTEAENAKGVGSCGKRRFDIFRKRRNGSASAA
jgi:hypothetical protein